MKVRFLHGAIDITLFFLIVIIVVLRGLQLEPFQWTLRARQRLFLLLCPLKVGALPPHVVFGVGHWQIISMNMANYFYDHNLTQPFRHEVQGGWSERVNVQKSKFR